MPSPTESGEVKERVRRLRERFGLTQVQVAEASGDLPGEDRKRLRRVEVVKLETGANLGSSARIREGLAAAFDVTSKIVGDYLEGRLTLEQLVDASETTKLRRQERSGAPALRSHPRWAALVREAQDLRALEPEDIERVGDLPFIWGPIEMLDAQLLADIASAAADWARRLKRISVARRAG